MGKDQAEKVFATAPGAEPGELSVVDTADGKSVILTAKCGQYSVVVLILRPEEALHLAHLLVRVARVTGLLVES